jgi:predicted 3-demethylubiquinone-9 3-methyltransferase (glyoxalase superfamily)
MNKIAANLWFDGNAEEAARFYTSIMPNSRITDVARYGEAGKEITGGEPGSVMTIDFELDGFGFTGLNGGPQFRPNPSISFFVVCRSEAEVDRIFTALSEGGTALMPLDSYDFSPRFGWIEDKYGVSWQVILHTEEPTQRVFPSLLFVGNRCGQAREALGYYTSVFRNSRPGEIFTYGEGREPEDPSHVMYGEAVLEGSILVAMDSSLDHEFDFNEGVSIIVKCDDQAEIDHYWEALSAVPEAEACGWAKDRFGVSWQIVPKQLHELMLSDDPSVSDAVMGAMLTMKKLDIAGLERAREIATSS